MKDDDRKILTEFLGESINHVWEIEGPTARCYQCGDVRDAESIPEAGPCRIRTFDTWEDFGAVWKKVDKKGLAISWIIQGEYERVILQSWRMWERETPERRCLIVLEAIKEGVL